MNVDGCRRVESGVKKRYESCFRPLHLFLVTEKKKKICVEGVKKNRPQTEKTAAFKAAGSDQFHIGPCKQKKVTATDSEFSAGDTCATVRFGIDKLQPRLGSRLRSL